MINDKKKNEVTDRLFQSRLSRYQFGFKTPMEDSDFIFGWVNLLQ